jgi:hypothetical protein
MRFMSVLSVSLAIEGRLARSERGGNTAGWRLAVRLAVPRNAERRAVGPPLERRFRKALSPLALAERELDL